ncbi:hypothetical protein OCK74_04930 [Chitinophagaceae bacterium LB-8]|uniref:T9SS type A sorting domain-containing protein n=1 Tax=Paraflavisolibacter caeni TaxID=2982496 RepID=A0A9X2XU17_9BACT|nr:hypothetical protein [Paraflavisolibacter caeni]MCU7548446.1 hypothetical protein [Paraflavisolibacter caeni]
MKHIYLLILSSLLFFVAFAGTKKLVVNNGDFSTANSWLPSVVPADGDVLIVPANYTLIVAKNINVAPNNITIIVDGTVDLTNGKLILGSGSAIYLSSSTAAIVSSKGNPADKITIGGSEKYNGQVGDIAGPALADISTATTSTATSGFVSPSVSTITTYELLAGRSSSSDFTVLPVKFLSFIVSKASTGVTVQWSTAQEINASVFHIERSEDSRTWRTIATVKAVGNSTNVQSYSYTDKTILNKVAYYRIKEVDTDGQYTYTDVKNVTNQSTQSVAANNVTIIANGNNVMVNFSKQVAGTVVVRLINFGGQVLTQQAYSQASQQIVFNKTYVNKGNYIISVSNNSDLNVAKQVAL